MIKHLQINDLEIDYLEAFVNSSSDISLLGQNVLERFGSINVDYKLNVLTLKK